MESKHGGMEASDLKRVKELESENAGEAKECTKNEGKSADRQGQEARKRNPDCLHEQLFLY